MKLIVFIGLFLIDAIFVPCQIEATNVSKSQQVTDFGTNATSTITTEMPNITSDTTPTSTPPNPTSTPLTPTSTPPTPIPTTAPSRDASVNTYKFIDGNDTCLLVSLKAYFNQSGSIVNVTKNFNIVPNESECGKAVVAFENNNFTLHFKNDSQNLYWLNQVDAHIDAFKADLSQTNLTIGQSKLKASYKCSSGFSVKFGNSTEMVATDVQFQAFEIPNGKFGTAQICSKDIGNEIIIPIAVGCALAGLIVLVLIAYMIGRKQVKHRYEAM